MENFDYWGQHLILDCKEGNIFAVTDEIIIAKFAEELVQSIKMKAYGKPIIVDFAHDDPKTGGITLVQLIETSNITCHFVSATGDFYLDVFSCSSFDNDVVIEIVQRYFQPNQIKQKQLLRKA